MAYPVRHSGFLIYLYGHQVNKLFLAAWMRLGGWLLDRDLRQAQDAGLLIAVPFGLMIVVGICECLKHDSLRKKLLVLLAISLEYLWGGKPTTTFFRGNSLLTIRIGGTKSLSPDMMMATS